MEQFLILKKKRYAAQFSATLSEWKRMQETATKPEEAKEIRLSKKKRFLY